MLIGLNVHPTMQARPLLKLYSIFMRSVLGVDRRSRTSEQKITSGRSPLDLITFITLLM